MRNPSLSNTSKKGQRNRGKGGLVHKVLLQPLGIQPSQGVGMPPISPKKVHHASEAAMKNLLTFHA